MNIGVIGASSCDRTIDLLAEEVGYLIAKMGHVLVTGGLGGVMEAASRGAKKGGGITVGILPGFSADEANAFIDIPVVTGMSHARNVILVRSSKAVIAVAGEYGTLSEIALALKIGIPVVGLESWKGIEGMLHVHSPSEAVDTALDLIKNNHMADRGR